MHESQKRVSSIRITQVEKPRDGHRHVETKIWFSDYGYNETLHGFD